MTSCAGERPLDWALRPGGFNHLAWHSAIRAVGLQFEYVTDRMMRRGEFDPGEYSVLILSQCEAIGPKEAEVIRDFVTSGGTLIADVRPGIYDGHCKPLEGGILDDLFGVRHAGQKDAVETTGRIIGRLGDREVRLEMPALHVNPAVELTTGRAIGHVGLDRFDKKAPRRGAPVFVVNRVGKGQAILLNFSLCSFAYLPGAETPEAARELFRQMFASGGVQWPLRLLDEKGAAHHNVEAVRWKAGDGIEVVGVHGPVDRRWMWSPSTSWTNLAEQNVVDVLARRVRLVLPEARHVVEIGSGRRAGPTTQFTVDLRMWSAGFVVLSDRPLEPPVLKAEADVVRRGGILGLEARIPDARGMHALKIRVKGSDGKEAPWFSRSVIVEEGRAQLELPIAWNEEVGPWTVTVTDLYTGASADASVRIE